MCAQVEEHALDLARDTYGNYVIQHSLQHGSATQRCRPAACLGLLRPQPCPPAWNQQPMMHTAQVLSRRAAPLPMRWPRQACLLPDMFRAAGSARSRPRQAQVQAVRESSVMWGCAWERCGA